MTRWTAGAWLFMLFACLAVVESGAFGERKSTSQKDLSNADSLQAKKLVEGAPLQSNVSPSHT
jgi:hypothetical protein